MSIVMERIRLKVPRRFAEKRLRILIGRGRRLAQLAQAQWENPARDVDIAVQARDWRGTVRAALLGIFPHSEQADIVTRGYDMAQSWPERLNAAADRLEEFIERIHDYHEPPITESIGQWLNRVPAVREWFDRGLWFGAGYVVCKGPEIMDWINRN